MRGNGPAAGEKIKNRGAVIWCFFLFWEHRVKGKIVGVGCEKKKNGI